MNDLRLLIVDDVEDNRMVLNAICRRMEGFEMKEAIDGIDAIAVCETWHPHIILMDVMMPNLDGFEASKVIKGRFPETVIIVVTAVLDPQMEANMATIDVEAYIHKPIDKELIQFKLQSFGAFLRAKNEISLDHTTNKAFNPLHTGVRHFKTIFNIHDAEGMMDFGIWLYSRCEISPLWLSSKVDPIIELFYELMRQGISEEEYVNINVEENFEEIFIVIKLAKKIVLNSKAQRVVDDLQSNCIINENFVCIRLNNNRESIKPILSNNVIEKGHESKVELIEQEAQIRVKQTIEKEVRTIDTIEQELLRQSFVHKTTAIDYLVEIGGNIFDEICDLVNLNEEWKDKLHVLECEPSIENISQFADGVMGVYVRAINNLFEFTALAYALSSLGMVMKERAEVVISEPEKLKLFVMLMEYLGNDLTVWIEHVFLRKDATDIHYMDSSFFSSCLHIEQIIGDKEIKTDDDNDIDFF